MSLPNPLRQGVELFRALGPGALKRAGARRISRMVEREATRSRRRVAALEKRYPSADTRELAQRLTEEKKNLAGMLGGVGGVFGLFSVPADAVLMAWLELTLLVDIATLYRQNLKSDRAREQLLELYGYTSGLGPLRHVGPKLFAKVGGWALRSGGFKQLGRAVPLVAAPVTAYLNNQHMQSVGERALHFYEGFGQVEKKRQAREQG